MQNKAQQELNKADENCEMKQQFYGQLLLFFATGKNTKINFRVAPQQNIKKINVRGLHILHIKNCQVFTIQSALGRVWGFVWILCKLSVKLEKLLQKEKTGLDLTLKVTIV